jgi:phosphoglycerate dehydrogenase-like enzyme
MRERTPFGRSVLERLPSLRLLMTAGSANAAIDVTAARELGIVVSGTTGRSGGVATTELTWALILSLVRSVPHHDAAVRHGGWQVGLGPVLRGKTLGILGLGNLGPLMLPVARALGMEVVAWSRNLTDQRAHEVGVVRLDRADFFATSDVVTVHLKLGTRSVGYVGRPELRLMKPTAYLVNTSRGPVVDEAALVEALREGWIAGAALDVFDVEPLPLDHPLRSLPNTVLSPHMGYVARESYGEYFASFVEDVRAFLAGTPLRVLDGDATS